MLDSSSRLDSNWGAESGSRINGEKNRKLYHILIYVSMAIWPLNATRLALRYLLAVARPTRSGYWY